MDEVGIRLEELINKLKTNQLRLAQDTGLNQSFLSAIIRGKKNISRDVLVSIVKRHPTVNLTWLLTGSGPVFLPESPNLNGLVLDDLEPVYRVSKSFVPNSTIQDDSELRKTLGENLVSLSECWGMKKNELFNLLMPGVQKQSITNYLKGASAPPLWVLLNLEQITGIGISTWLSRRIEAVEYPKEPLRPGSQTLTDTIKKDLLAIIQKMG